MPPGEGSQHQRTIPHNSGVGKVGRKGGGGGGGGGGVRGRGGKLPLGADQRRAPKCPDVMV